jgi:hypothetical protein
VAGCCECGDESSGSCATELVSYLGYSRLKVARCRWADIQGVPKSVYTMVAHNSHINKDRVILIVFCSDE